MDLIRHLRHFMAVAEELHFGRAAEVLGMAQPPLSQSIQRLERELGVRLFDRDSRRVSITAAGRVLLPECRALVEQADQLMDSVRAARRGGAGGLRVAVPTGLEPSRLASLLHSFAAAEPDVPLELSELSPSGQRASLRAGHQDVAVLNGPTDDPSLEVGPAVRESLGVAVPIGSPFARLPALHLSDLGETPLVLIEGSDEAADRVLQETCVRGGYRPARVLHVGGLGVALALVMAGQAVALAPRSSMPSGNGLGWVPLLGNPLWRELVPVWRASLDPALTDAFCEALRRAFDPSQTEGHGADADPPGGTRPSSSELL